MVSYILAVVVAAAVLGIDQLTKAYVAANFTLATSREFIPGIIDLTYIHNDGGAWGMLGGYTWILLSVTIIIMLVCITLLLKYGSQDKLMFWAIMLVLSGGVGNMIDRIFRDGNVVDFLHFAFMPDFPVFNVADCAIVIGAGLLLLYYLLGTIKETREKRISVKTEDAQAVQENAEN